jgi:EpsI family protein
VSALRRRGMTGHAVCVFLLLTSTLIAAKLTSYRHSGILDQSLDTIPYQLAGFTAIANPPLQESVLKELKATSYIARTYKNRELEADVFVAYYAQQRAGESMHSPKHCLPGAGWEIWQYETIQLPSGGSTFAVNKYSISHEGERKVVLYWYQSKERVFASEYLGKLLLARDALLQNSTAAAIVRVMVPDQEQALSAGSELASEMIGQMRRCFGR